jgi:hypothetical protein
MRNFLAMNDISGTMTEKVGQFCLILPITKIQAVVMDKETYCTTFTALRRRRILNIRSVFITRRIRPLPLASPTRCSLSHVCRFMIMDQWKKSYSEIQKNSKLALSSRQSTSNARNKSNSTISECFDLATRKSLSMSNHWTAAVVYINPTQACMSNLHRRGLQCRLRKCSRFLLVK